MLARLILLLVQLAIGWFAAPQIARHLPHFGSGDIFIYAVIFAILVTLIGFVGSLVLQGVGTPTTGTLTTSLVLALVFAALTLVPAVTGFVSGLGLRIPLLVYPLIGAVLGYAIKR
jgi:hypothetical protein